MAKTQQNDGDSDEAAAGSFVRVAALGASDCFRRPRSAALHSLRCCCVVFFVVDVAAAAAGFRSHPPGPGTQA